MHHEHPITPEVVRLTITQNVMARQVRVKMSGSTFKELVLATEHDKSGPISTYIVLDNGAVRLANKNLAVACEVYNGIEL